MGKIFVKDKRNRVQEILNLSDLTKFTSPAPETESETENESETVAE